MGGYLFWVCLWTRKGQTAGLGLRDSHGRKQLGDRAAPEAIPDDEWLWMLSPFSRSTWETKTGETRHGSKGSQQEPEHFGLRVKSPRNLVVVNQFSNRVSSIPTGANWTLSIQMPLAVIPRGRCSSRECGKTHLYHYITLKGIPVLQSYTLTKLAENDWFCGVVHVR